MKLASSWQSVRNHIGSKFKLQFKVRFAIAPDIAHSVLGS